MEIDILHKSGKFEDYLNALLDRDITVKDSFGTCKFIDVRESCESRQYIDGFATYSKEVVLGNGECMFCWDESADLAFPLAQEYGFEETLIAAG